MPARPVLARLRAAVFLASLLPFGALLYGVYAGTLGANPVETITRSTGWWCLVFLMLTLAVTPLRRLAGWPWLLRLRRMLGLYAFFYGLAHVTAFVWFEHWFDLAAMLRDVWKRPFVTVGFAAFALMLPLALTSTDAMVRRLGGRAWQRLHRLVYAVAILGVVHYWWLVKADLREPIAFAAVLAGLLGARLAWRARDLARTPAGPCDPLSARR